VDTIIRPAAVLTETAAHRIVTGLAACDVSLGGLWSVSTTLWQRYDRPWDGLSGMRGTAQLAGTLAVIYDSPQRHSITVYRASLTERGVELGWTPETLCDDALSYAGLTLARCPRAELRQPPTPDPFYREDADRSLLSPSPAPPRRPLRPPGPGLP
jgi:hypothetical protein